MIENKPSPVYLIQGLSVVHMVMVIGQVIFLAVAFFLVSKGNFGIIVQNNPRLQIIVPVVAGGIYIFSFLFFRNRLQFIRGLTGTDAKINAYRSALILKFALTEMLIIFSGIIYLFTSAKTYLIIAAILVCAFLIVDRPSKERAMNDLELSFNEREEMGLN